MWFYRMKMFLGRYVLLEFCILLISLTIAGCDKSSPTAPSPVVRVEGPGFLTQLSCPADVTLTSDNGPMVVTFSQPTLSDETEVTKSSCDPASGSVFPFGVSQVICSVTDAETVATSCAFSVMVLPPGMLGETKFVAFGDSITKGVLGLTFMDLVNPENSYPTQLEYMLRDMYPDQTITMVNAGRGGETSSEGRSRISQVLSKHNPGVLMVLEGINNLLVIGAPQAAQDLRSIAQRGKARGAEVLLATLTPIGDKKEKKRPGLRDTVRDLNREIRQIARQLGIGPAVDLFQAFEGNPSLLGDDGVHPTVEGYYVMAEEFFHAIVSRVEISRGQSSPFGLFSPPVFAPE